MFEDMKMLGTLDKLKKSRNVRLKVQSLRQEIVNIVTTDEMQTIENVVAKMKESEPQMLRDCVSNMTTDQIIKNAGKIKYYSSRK